MQPTKKDIGKLVEYYLEGTRYGYVKNIIKNKKVVIQPISAFNGKKPHSINVDIQDTKLVEDKC